MKAAVLFKLAAVFAALGAWADLEAQVRLSEQAIAEMLANARPVDNQAQTSGNSFGQISRSTGPLSFGPLIEALMPEDIRNVCYGNGSPFGPLEIKEGEAVVCADPQGLPAVSTIDASKWLPPQDVRERVFIYLSGDPRSSVRLLMPSTNETVTITKPAGYAYGTAPLIRLAPLKSIIGVPKAVLENRLKAPTDIQLGADGREVWHYHGARVETKRELRSATAFTVGGVGGTSFNSSTTAMMPVTLTRTVVMYDFKLVIGPDGKVQSLAKGSVGASEWQLTP